jgi:hypothetical protein
MVSNSGFAWKGDDLRLNPLHLITANAGTASVLAEELPADDSDGQFMVGQRADYLGSKAVAVLADLSVLVWERLAGGPGLAILGGDGLADLSDAQLRHLIFGISLALGRPMAQNPAGDVLVSVRDEAPQDPQARGYRTREHLPMHTDAADVAGLMCVRQGISGGGNSFVSAETVHDVLCDEEPELIPEYYRRWEWDRRGLEPPSARPTLSSSIFSYYRGHLSCRYAPKLLREGATRAGGALSPAQVKALARFEAVASRSALRFSHTLRRGESVWLNNYAVLHARDSFTDGGQADSARHLLRTWVWAHEGRSLAPLFVSPKEVY